MNMTLNEALARHNFITKILLKSNDSSLSKDLKVKIMTMRIELGKIRKSFDEDLKEFIEGIKPENYNELGSKENKSEEEIKEFNTMHQQLIAEHDLYVSKKSMEDVTFDVSFTEEEYYEIIEVNSDKDVEINGATISAPDFLEVLYSLFVA